MSHGPFSLLKSLVVGVIGGSLVFIALAASTGGPENNHAQQLRTWLYIVGGGLALSLTLCAALNYTFGRRVRQQIEHSRKLFSGSQMRRAARGQDASGFILRPDSDHPLPEPRTSSHDSNQFEGQH